MTSQFPLTLNSAIAALPLHRCQACYTITCAAVLKTFKQDPHLPGVIITDTARVVGMISRRKFLAYMGLSQNSDVYLERPIIQAVLNWVKTKPLELPITSTIHEAVQKGLQRPRETLYDPIVVRLKDNTLRLLDFHQLLLNHTQLAQSSSPACPPSSITTPALSNHLSPASFTAHSPVSIQPYDATLQPLNGSNSHTLAPPPCPNNSLCQSSQSSPNSTTLNPDVQRALQRYQKYISLPPNSNRSLLTEPGFAKADHPPDRLAGFDQQILHVGQTVSAESQQVFQSTQEAVKTFYLHTDHLIAISKTLAKELEAIHSASELIQQVSRQSQFLGLHTAILANRFGSSELEGFSRVASEVAQLSRQTLEAGRRVGEIEEQLRTSIEDLLQIAQGEATVGRSLIPKISRAKTALIELEKLLGEKDLETFERLREQSADDNAATSQAADWQMQRASGSVIEPDRDADYQDLQSLIRKAEQTLKQSKKSIRREWYSG